MALRVPITPTETQKRRSLLQRMGIVYLLLLLALLTIIARLLELQIVRGSEYHEVAQAQHFGGLVLPAKRGEILGVNSKTGELTILATNSTLDLVYVDPLITDDPTFVSETLADILVTEEFSTACSDGNESCPRELIPYYAPAFDPIERWERTQAAERLLEPLPEKGNIPKELLDLPDLPEVRRRFARDIEERISEKRVTFVPLVFGATKTMMRAVEELAIPGIEIDRKQKLIYANPESVKQLYLDAYARKLAGPLEIDPLVLRRLLRSRLLRYVPIMRRLPPTLSAKIREAQLASLKETLERRKQAPTVKAAQELKYPLRSIALIPEHWRFYPDTTIASHVIGFLNTNGEAQYGIERTYNPQLRGQEGLITTVSDPMGRQILTAEQRIINPRDGDTIVLTIDRAIQKEVESIMEQAVEHSKADSGQAIIMDPFTGRILAMANAPLFDSNNYAVVYEKEPLLLDPGKEKQVVVEIYHPETNARIVKAYLPDVFPERFPGMTATGSVLSEKTHKTLVELSEVYDLADLARYYLYIGENNQYELFPTEQKGFWLKYRNNIGVGAYLNRTIQEIYEPGSVLKPVTMATAIDQGEVTPQDIYDDKGPVQVDEYTIKNALLTYYGKVTMTNCLELSINTCMTSVSSKLGPKLFHRMLERFGFGRITGVELEDELPGEMLPWRQWSRALLATAAFGQGISATPLQVVTAFAALANGGKLMRPTIIHQVIHPDGTKESVAPRIVDQVVTAETSDTITAMLYSSVERGYAKPAKVKGHKIAGKTGTSQIAGPGGRYEKGTGSTLASFVGYAPIDHPRFVVLVKIDRPKAGKIIHGAQAAAPVFKEIAEFLFKYYGIPPDEI